MSPLVSYALQGFAVALLVFVLEVIVLKVHRGARLFSYWTEAGEGWLRLGRRGPGITWKARNAPALFSERHGFVAWYRVARWRVSYLPTAKARYPLTLVEQKKASWR